MPSRHLGRDRKGLKEGALRLSGEGASGQKHQVCSPRGRKEPDTPERLDSNMKYSVQSAPAGLEERQRPAWLEESQRRTTPGFCMSNWKSGKMDCCHQYMLIF